VFVDFYQAYNSIDGTRLINILYEFGVLAKLVRLVKETAMNTTTCIKLQAELGNPLKVNSGLKEGVGWLLSSLILPYNM
jgi:hypothetical protein